MLICSGFVGHWPRHSLPPASSTTQIAVIFCETSNPTKRVIDGLRRCESPGDTPRIAALSADQAPTAIIGCSYFPVDQASLDIDECQQAVLAFSFAARSAMFGKPGDPEQEGNDMAFRPLHDRVVVKRLEGEEKTKGGIIIPDTVKEKPQEGKIIAVGPGGRDETGKLTPLDVKAGDRILFGKWSGSEVKIDGDDLLIMKESDILGVVD
jgi:chaperonin GroES